MNNLTIFNTREDYNKFKNSPDMPVVNTSYISDEAEVEYFNDIQAADYQPFTVEILNVDNPLRLSFVYHAHKGHYTVKYKINNGQWKSDEINITDDWAQDRTWWNSDEATVETGDKFSIIISYDKQPMAQVGRFFVDQNKGGLQVKLSGNIMSLYSGNYTTVTTNDIFEANKDHLEYFNFAMQWSASEGKTQLIDDYDHEYYNEYIIDAGDLILPRYGLTQQVFRNMFHSCIYLTSAPDILAKSLPLAACSFMFKDCSSLATAPVISTENIDEYSFESMFQGCSSLAAAPSLLPSKIPTAAYSNMFNGCSSLTAAPILTATQIEESGYNGMFRDCTSLTYVKCLAEEFNGSMCVDDMLSNVGANGELEIPSSAHQGYWTDHADQIPEDWTVIEINS